MIQIRSFLSHPDPDPDPDFENRIRILKTGSTDPDSDAKKIDRIRNTGFFATFVFSRLFSLIFIMISNVYTTEI